MRNNSFFDILVVDIDLNMSSFFKRNIAMIITFLICIVVVIYFYFNAIGNWNKARKIYKDNFENNCSSYQTSDYENITSDSSK